MKLPLETQLARWIGPLAIAVAVLSCGDPSAIERPDSDTSSEVASRPQSPDVPPPDGVLRPAEQNNLEVELSAHHAPFAVRAVAVVGETTVAGGVGGLLDLGRGAMLDERPVLALGTMGDALFVLREDELVRVGENGEQPVLAGVPHETPRTFAVHGDELWIATSSRIWVVTYTGSQAELRQIAASDDWRALHAADVAHAVIAESSAGRFVSIVTGEEGTERVELNALADLDFALPASDARIIAAMDGELIERRHYADGPMWLWRALRDDAAPVVTHAAVDPRDGATWVATGTDIYRVDRDHVAVAPMPDGIGELTAMTVTRDGRVWLIGGQALVALSPVGGLHVPGDSAVTYADVERASATACVSCHVGGQAADVMPLGSYDDWVAAADLAITEIQAETMPPAPADPIPAFAELLLQWRANGFAKEEQP